MVDWYISRTLDTTCFSTNTTLRTLNYRPFYGGCRLVSEIYNDV